MTDPRLARTMWHRLEPINAVIYFSPEPAEAAVRLGLKGFWMGYFAFRAAPMGPVDAAVVEATFFNFHATRVRRAIPEAWTHAGPEAMVEARSSAASAALRRLLSDEGAERTAAAVLPALESAIDGAVAAGRPLFAANRDVPRPADPVAALWHAATTLREHRGDGHMSLLASAGLDGCESLALFARCRDLPAELFFVRRGWSPDEWQAALDHLTSKGLVAADEAPTPAGRELHLDVEHRTDELAAAPYARLGDEAVRDLLVTLEEAQRSIVAADAIPFPNPMGLPPPAA